MDVGLRDLGQAFDFQVLAGRVVGFLGREHPVDEDQPDPVDLAEDRRLARVEQRGGGDIRLGQAIGAG
jgi:hypothetical protein